MDLIAVGRISKPVGFRGEVKVLPLTDNKQRFADLQSVWVGSDETTVENFAIIAVRINARQIVVSFKGIETSDKAEGLRDKYLFVPKEKAVKLRSGSYFVDDVIGCEVMMEGHKKVGVITDLFALPENDVWIVWNGVKEILIPAVKAIIRHVDVEKKCIVINELEGLLE